MTGDKKTNRGSIAIRGISYFYPGRIPALDSVSFEVSPGEKVGLIGPNGAGKSTLLLCLPGLIEGFSGVIEIDGITVDHRENLKELRRRVGLVFQDNDDQLFNPTIIEDVAFGPLNLGLDREEAMDRSKNALTRVGLAEHMYSRPPHRVSGGQKRRAAIAGILAMEPSVLLLDEPTSDLDPRGINNLARLLNELPQTMIIATHNLEFVLLTCSRVVVLDEGKVITSGDPREVMADREFMESHGLEKPHSLVPHEHQDHIK
jgi:cobalt/nickel transport system ATP-binding protein